MASSSVRTLTSPHERPDARHLRTNSIVDTMSPLKPSLLRFKFEDFENLPSALNEEVGSEEMNDCHGNSWQLYIIPGGNSVSDDPFVRVYIVYLGGSSMVARASFILRDIHGKVFHEEVTAEYRFELVEDLVSVGDFLTRSTILNKTNEILVDGALLIDAHLQFMPEPESLHTTPSSILNKMMKLLENGEGDVSFRVGDEAINAHRLILQMNTSVLFNFCEEHNDGSPILINDTTPDIFHIILRYIYGEEVPDITTIKAKGKMIIDAANRFGVVDLKIAVETALVKALVINMKNVADWLIFADAKTCPLLKEQAIAYFISRSADILNSDASKELEDSPQLLAEFILARGTGENPDNRFGEEQHLSVGELRKRLCEKGLDVNGSKEILISRLQESNKGQREE